MTGPLNGVKIVDLTTTMMGPYATQLLGDMGAEIIKVETSGGDPVRGIDPSRHPGMGAPFLIANRGKRSIVLDLKKTEGREVLLKLCARSDLFIYNVRPKAMAKLNLAYEDVRRVNPRIIYAGVFGYGQKGKYAQRPAYDDLIQGASGLASLFQASGNDSPRYVPLAFVDRVVALAAIGSILAALYHREKTSEGQSIEIPMFETMAGFVLGDHFGGQLFDPPAGPTGYSRVLSKHRRPYPTKDGFICAVVYNDEQWRRFLFAIGQPTLFDSDPRFKNMTTRTNNIDSIYEMVGNAMRELTTAECEKLLDEADIPVAPLHTVDSLLKDEHLVSSGFFQDVEHPSEGKLRMPSFPIKFSKTNKESSGPAPRLGEHTQEILEELGYQNDEIKKLVEKKVASVRSSKTS